MNHSTRVTRLSRRARPRPAPAAAVLIATAAVALLAACSGRPSSAGSGGSPGAGGSAAAPSAVAYSACMRSHGVPNYPDPPSGGQLPKTGAQLLGVSASQYQAAQQACRPMLPAGRSLQQQEHQCMQNSDCPPALVQQMMTGDLTLARCMRSHGVLNWPDPTIDAEGRPGFNLVPVHGTNWNSPQIQNKIYQCEHVMPAGGGVPAIYPGAPG